MARVKNGAEVIGLPDLSETLTAVMPREAKNILRRTTYGLATVARDRIRERAPERTGRLKRSIKAKRDRGTSTEMAASVIADKSGGRSGSGFHAHFLEFGTVKMGAQPFINPAVEELRPQVPGIYRDQFGIHYERELAKRNKKPRR